GSIFAEPRRALQEIARMSHMKIFGKSLTKEEVKELVGLVVDAGCAADEIKIIESVSEPELNCEDEVILVLATPQTCSDPNLEGELSNVPDGGRRAIWVWPKDATTAEVPEGTKKYSYSIIPWSAEKLAAVVADDDFTCFELPTGESLPKVEMERNLC